MTKLTRTIDKGILSKAKREAHERRIPVSRAVENFLDFLANPWLYCFSCGERFEAKAVKTCAKCGWLVCPACGACRCKLCEREAVAVFYMRRVYEDLLGEG